MNIYEMRARIRFHVNRVSSARYPNDRIEQALQVATDDFIQDRYHNIKDAAQNYSFEVMERIRAELRTLVVTLPGNLNTQNELTLPDDYRYDVGLMLRIGGVIRGSRPVTQLEYTASFTNSRTRPNALYPVHREIGSVLKVDYGATGATIPYTFYYLKKQTYPVIGTPFGNSGALTVGQTYYVDSGTVTHNAVNYTQGQSFVAANASFSGAGTVFLGVDSGLPDTTQEEICRRAATILSGVSQNMPNLQIKDAEVKSN